MHSAILRLRTAPPTFWPTVVVLLLLWIFASIFNLTKAYHIDDTVYLRIAQWILQHPFHPMSGNINWGETEKPFYSLNQPHLFPYLLALWGWFFGFGEFPMHVLQSFFVLGCIIILYRIARMIVPARALFVTAVFAVSPVFVVGQNLMVDVSLLFFWLVTFYFLMKSAISNERPNLIFASVMAGIACLIKYSSVTLIAVIGVWLTVTRRLHSLWFLGIPLLMLALYACFNLLDYGGIHILQRSIATFSLEKWQDLLLAFPLTLGAVVPYGPFLLLQLPRTRVARLALVLTFLVVAAFIVFAASSTSQKQLNLFLELSFVVNGILLIGYVLLQSLRTGPLDDPFVLLLFLWVCLGISFIIASVPFMAPRHVLLIIVPITLLAVRFSPPPKRYWDIATLLVTAFLSMALGISDQMWANFYKETSAQIRREVGEDVNLYFAGHWGWQWYATENGMRQLDSLGPPMKPGDYLAYATGIHNQQIPESLHLKVLKKYRQKWSPLLLFSTRLNGGFYISDYQFPPWTLSRRPIAPIVLYRVEDR